jgi:predicted transcriptional regulator
MKIDMEVLERFSAAFQNNSSPNKTQMHLKTRLRWDSFSKYLELLLEKEFLEYRTVNSVQCYSMTERGVKMFHILTIFSQCFK